MRELGGNSAAISEGLAQLQVLASLQRQIGTASPSALATIRGEIAAVVSQANSAMQQGRTAATAELVTEEADVATLAATSRAQVTAIMRDMHRFDPYLSFASPEDENAYRQREADRLAYIAAEQAKGTPQGDLNAAGGAVGQMVDAAAHGAGNSPEFRERFDELLGNTQRLREQMLREGRDVSEFDRNLREDLRRILRSKGMSDAQIDARFAAHSDPLEAARDLVENAGDLAQIESAANRAADAPDSARTTAAEAPSVPGLDALMANLQSAGVTMSDAPPSGQPSHGVTVAVATPVSSVGRGSSV